MSAAWPPPPDPLPVVAIDDHGNLTVFRVWHPTTHAPAPTDVRSWGPLYRFDPHTPPSTDPGQDPGGRVAWYAGEAFDTALLERFNRGQSAVEVCARHFAAAVVLPASTPLLDLTVRSAEIGAPYDLGDRADNDYDDTRVWARAVYDSDIPAAGLRYFSARHRDADGARYGVNVVLWRALEDAEVSQAPLASGGGWRRTVAALDRAGVAADRVERCGDCLN